MFKIVLHNLGFVFYLLFTGPLFAQTNENNQTFMIRIAPEVGMAQFGKAIPLAFKNLTCVDKEYQLYSVQLPFYMDSKWALDILNRTNGCLVSQKTHAVDRRFSPADPFIGSQNYLNIIQAYDAWDHARGKGVSGFGDTLVIAQFDDGLDTLHPDITKNIWRNHSEIPWNGIDDDSNGYKDDYYGWNGGDSNCRVVTSQSIGQGHGTATAGVMAAVTDNGIGIAGLSYNAKIMPLLCYSTIGLDGEIAVVKCMIYAIQQKKLYISSNGKKGANIVVANFSLGIDKLFAKDAPIWCAFYDSMGAVGILSAGATSDADNDVDAVGDIPTSCPSKYLITVSYTNNNDVRVPSGYSPTKIDLAAPGQNIFTTRQRRDAGANPPYSTQSGTSFSTPMVTGAIAFVYNNACDTFLKLQKKDNDSALSLLSQWVLKGTDILPSLAGKCATEGRLNLYKVWQNMNAWCSLNDQKYAVKNAGLSAFSLHPNPVQSGEIVYISGLPSKPFKYEITDLAGKSLYQAISEIAPNGQQFYTNTLSPGLYLFRITIGDLELVRKLQVF